MYGRFVEPIPIEGDSGPVHGFFCLGGLVAFVLWAVAFNLAVRVREIGGV